MNRWGNGRKNVSSVMAGNRQFKKRRLVASVLGSWDKHHSHFVFVWAQYLQLSQHALLRVVLPTAASPRFHAATAPLGVLSENKVGKISACVSVGNVNAPEKDPTFSSFFFFFSFLFVFVCFIDRKQTWRCSPSAKKWSTNKHLHMSKLGLSITVLCAHQLNGCEMIANTWFAISLQRR